MAWVFENGPSDPSERLVLLALADYAADNGEWSPSMIGIASKAGMTERGARGVIRRLEAGGWIAVKVGGGRGGRSQYRVLMERGNTERQTGNNKPGMAIPEQRSVKNSENPERDDTKPGTSVPPNRQEPSERREANASLSSGDDDKHDEVREALAMFNAMAAECCWPQVRILSPARRSALSARLRECGGIAGWADALAKARASPHCNGQNDRGWVANFDFLTRQSSFAKLMEGNYDDRAFRQHQPADRPQNRPDPALDQIARLAGLGQTSGYDRH